MKSQHDTFAEILRAHALPCGALLSREDVVSHVGEIPSIGGAGLASILLDQFRSFSDVEQMLAGQLLPRIFEQDDHFAFLDKVGSLCILVFGTSEGRRDVAALHDFSQAVHKSLNDAFGE